MNRSPFLLALLGVLAVATWPRPVVAAPRYDEVMMASTHNSMQKWQDPQDIWLYYNVRSLEWDIHAAGDEGIWSDWRVYHTGIENETHCYTLGECLGLLKGFHDLVPEHEVMTIFLDSHGSFFPNYRGGSIGDMDDLLTSTLGSSAIFKPSDLMALCPWATSLQQAVMGSGDVVCDWPTLDQLRGKCIFVLGCVANGAFGEDCPGSEFPQSEYLSHSFFKMIDSPPAPDDDLRIWTQYDNQYNVLFWNWKFDGKPLGGPGSVLEEAQKRHFITRVYDLNDAGSLEVAKLWGVNLLAGDTLDTMDHPTDPAALGLNPTVSSSNWPFTCRPGVAGCSDAQSEPSNRTFTLGNATGSSMYYTTSSTRQATIGGAIGLAYPQGGMFSDGTWVDQSGYGCLNVRSSAGAARFFSVCRKHDTQAAYVAFNNGVQSKDIPGTAPAFANFYHDADHGYDYAYAKIVLKPSGSGVTASGYTCAGPSSCTFIGSASFPNDTLPVRGAFVHNTSATFTNVMIGGIRLTDAAPSTVTYSGATATRMTGWTVPRRPQTAYEVVPASTWFFSSPSPVPPGGMFFADLHGTIPDADLFTDRATHPTVGTNRCKSVSITSFEECQTVETSPVNFTNWYAGVRGWGNAPLVELDTSVMAYNILDQEIQIGPHGAVKVQFPAQLGQMVRVATYSSGDTGLYLAADRVPTTSDADATSDWTGTGYEAVRYVEEEGHKTIWLLVTNNTASTVESEVQVWGD